MKIEDPRNFFLNSVEDRFNAADEMVRKHGQMLKQKAKGINARKKRSSTPLPEPEPSEEDDILRPKDRMKGTGAYLRKRESFEKMMGVEDEPAPSKNTTPLPEPEPSAEEDILRPKDRMKGTGAYLRKRESFEKMMGVEGEPTPSKPKAQVVAEDEVVQSFFTKAHGGSYDPNSRIDKAKMQKILSMVNAQPELLSLSPGKFAVKLYASK